MTTHPQWLVPISDGSAPVKIEIRDQVVPPCVHVDLVERERLFTPMEAVQVAQAIQDASRYAAQLWVKARKR